MVKQKKKGQKDIKDFLKQTQEKQKQVEQAKKELQKIKDQKAAEQLQQKNSIQSQVSQKMLEFTKQRTLKQNGNQDDTQTKGKFGGYKSKLNQDNLSLMSESSVDEDQNELQQLDDIELQLSTFSKQAMASELTEQQKQDEKSLKQLKIKLKLKEKKKQRQTQEQILKSRMSASQVNEEIEAQQQQKQLSEKFGKMFKQKTIVPTQQEQQSEIQIENDNSDVEEEEYQRLKKKHKERMKKIRALTYFENDENLREFHNYQPQTSTNTLQPRIEKTNLRIQDKKIAAEKKAEKQSKYLIFYPFKTPPEWQVSFDHAKACRVGLPIDNQIPQLCKCCNQQINRTYFSIFQSSQQLSYLGAGYPLFYLWMEQCIFQLFLLLIFSSGYNIYSNQQGDYCKLVTYSLNDCQFNSITQYSLINKGNQTDNIVLCSILNMVTGIILMIITLKFQIKCSQFEKKDHFISHHPQDYTIRVSNIPKNLYLFDYKSKLRKLFEQDHIDGSKSRVTKINLCFDLSNLKDLTDKIESLKFLKEQHEYEIEKERDNLSKLQKLMQTDMQDQYGQIVIAQNELIISKQDVLNEIEQQINDTESEAFFSKANMLKNYEQFCGVGYVSFANENFKNYHIKNNELQYFDKIYRYLGLQLQATGLQQNINGQRLVIESAQDPKAILWLNNKYSVQQKTKKYLKSFFYYIILLVISFFVIFLLKLWQLYLTKQVFEENKQIITQETDDYVYVSYIIACLIGIFNRVFLEIIINQNIAVMEPVDYQIGFRYAELTQTMFFTFFYAPVIPQCVIISLISFIFYYFIDKYNLFNKRRVKDNVCMELQSMMAEIFNINLFLFAVIFQFIYNKSSQMIFEQYLVDQNIQKSISQPTIYFFVISTMFLILPIKKFIDWQLTQEIKLMCTSYDDAKMMFDTDYDWENPVTKSFTNQGKHLEKQIKKETLKQNPENGVQLQQSFSGKLQSLTSFKNVKDF